MQKKKRVSTTHEKKIIPIQMDATFFFERAVQSLDRFHYDKALKYFRRAVEYEDDNPVNYCNLAGVLSEMGQYEESNMILQQIMDDIDPKMTECYFYMANNYANMEDYELAEKALVRYLENDPSGNFLEESQEMMELLSYELGRPAELCEIKSREGLLSMTKYVCSWRKGNSPKRLSCWRSLSGRSRIFWRPVTILHWPIIIQDILKGHWILSLKFWIWIRAICMDFVTWPFFISIWDVKRIWNKCSPFFAKLILISRNMYSSWQPLWGF